MTPIKQGRNDRCACGSLLKYKNCCGRQASSEGQISPAFSRLVATRCMEGFFSYESGDLAHAERICTELLQQSRRLPDAIHLLGMIRAKQALHQEALVLFDECLSMAQVSSMYSNKGLSLHALGRTQEAEVEFKKSIGLDPNIPQVRINYALLLMAAGRYGEAISQFEAAISLDSKLASPLGEMALCYVALADWPRAEQVANRAIQVKPDEFNAHSALSTVCMQRFEFERAAFHFEAAKKSDPTSILLLENYFGNLIQTNRTNEAKEILRDIFARTGRIESKVHELLSIPVIYQDADEIRLWRQKFEIGLDSVMTLSRLPENGDVQALYNPTIFYLAFHGQNDVGLMRKYARTFEYMCPDILYQSRYLNEVRGRSGPMRIGFLCRNVHDHPVTHCFSALIEFISRQEDTDSYLLSVSGFELSDQQGTYRHFKGRKIAIPSNYLAARTLIEELKLDVLIYTDIGMDPLSYCLASARLAPVQCSVPGHPVTTGISNIDYYFTTWAMEPTDASEQYTEKLIPIENFSRFREVSVALASKRPEDFGLPAGSRLYMCPMMLQKLHPEFDDAIAEILKLDPEGIVVLFETKEMPWKGEILRRFSRRFTPAILERIRFLPHIRAREEFVEVLKMADVVIDPFHFGLGSTSAFIAAAEVPFVSWPGKTMRGRVALWLSQVLQVPEAIVWSREDYANRAISIAKDKTLRQSIENQIRLNRSQLFETNAGINQFYDRTRELVARARVV